MERGREKNNWWWWWWCVLCTMCWLEKSDYSVMEMQQTCRTPLSAWLEPAAYEPGAVQQRDAVELIWRQRQLVISTTSLSGILLLGDNSYVNWNVFELCILSLVHLFDLLSYTELLEGRDRILFIFGFSEPIIMPWCINVYWMKELLLNYKPPEDTDYVFI